MSPLRFFLYTVFSFLAFAGLVAIFAWFQNWIDRGLEDDALRRAQWDDAPPGPPAGDVPKAPR